MMPQHVRGEYVRVFLLRGKNPVCLVWREGGGVACLIYVFYKHTRWGIWNQSMVRSFGEDMEYLDQGKIGSGPGHRLSLACR